jgi:hypothetical protein
LIRLADGAVLFFNIGSESLTDDRAPAIHRRGITFPGHGDRDDPAQWLHKDFWDCPWFSFLFAVAEALSRDFQALANLDIHFSPLP